MNKLVAGILACGLSITVPVITSAQEVIEFTHQDNNYYQTLNPHGTAHYTYKVPAATFGVFTLKNSSSSSDFDIYVYENQNWTLLNKGENQGVQTELITTPIFSEDGYVYIKIVNSGSQASEYKFYANHVSPVEKMAMPLFAAAICGFQGDTARDEVSERVLTTVLSTLEGNNLAGIAQDLLIAEVTNSMRNQMGYGCTGDFVVNWMVSVIKDVYKNY